MTATFQLNPSELTENLLAGIRKIANGYPIKITVETTEIDETDYLLSTEANRNALEQAMASKSRYSFSMEEFEAISERMNTGEKVDVEGYRITIE